MPGITPENIERCKESLRDHLIDRVILRISGRDGEDIVRNPRSSLFAGVLMPRFLSPSDSEGIQEKQQTSSLGFDFRVKRTDKSQPIRLIIKPQFSVYYSVFPSWDAVEKDNATLSGNKSDNARSELILPIIFRRKEVVAGETLVEIYEHTLLQKNISLNHDIENAKKAIENDPYRWRHLGKAKEQVRSIGLAKDIKTEAEYNQRIEEIRNNASKQNLPEWIVALHVEVSTDVSDPSLYRIKVLLCNQTLAWDDSIEDKRLDERALFDALINVTIQNAAVVPFLFLLAEKDYRIKPQMIAKGINCVVYHDAVAQSLITETLPIYEQPLLRSKQNSEIRFESLDVDSPSSEIIQIADSMATHLKEWDEYLKGNAATELSSQDVTQCVVDQQNFSKERDAFLLGVECLQQEKRLMMAFQLMNRVFYRLAKKSGGKIEAWRLFQICFIVSQLPSLMAREMNDSHNEKFREAVMQAFQEVTVLWFPTGGGKTEAYLGLIATALLFDRLRGKTHGLNTWMRFPLRMLSLQQMERLAKVIAELNILRSEEEVLQKGDPFSIGYYVGDTVTPNSVSETDMNYYEDRNENRRKLLLLRRCPYCNSPVEIIVDRTQWRILHVCTNANCFSNTSASLGHLKGSLLLYVVDKEIYRYLPSVLVGTVDKLAIAGFNAGFSHLFKGARQKCPDHGFTSYGSCLETYSAKCKNNKTSSLVKVDPLKDPGPCLLIQDELHLLKADLGVFNGHYEGFLQYVGRKVHLPPKVLAATATIEAYEKHAFHLYLKTANRFPVPSWKKGESFYATSIPIKTRRKYIGILCHSKAIDEAASRLIFLYQFEIRRLKAEFSEARTAMDNQDIEDKDIKDILTLYDLSVGYVNRKATGSSLLYKLALYNDDFEFFGFTRFESELLTGDRNPEDIGICLERIEAERKYTEDNRLDVVAATSLISHGVDLERINMLVVCGMPSHYAEYVQTSSRSARAHPGCVFSCFLSKDLREVSQFEMFMPMHENLDSLIESVAVNRFASFAPDKTIPGLLSALLINDLSPTLYGSDTARPLTHVPTVKVALGLKTTGSSGTTPGCIQIADLLAALREIIGVDKDWPNASPKEIENIRQRISEILNDLVASIGRSPENSLPDVLNPITSFRDVDEGLDFMSLNSPGLVTRISGR